MNKKEKEICIAWIKRTIELFGYALEDSFYDFDPKIKINSETEIINAIHKLLKELGKNNE